MRAPAVRLGMGGRVGKCKVARAKRLKDNVVALS